MVDRTEDKNVFHSTWERGGKSMVNRTNGIVAEKFGGDEKRSLKE